VVDIAELRRMATDPEMQRKVRDGIAKIAATLGLGSDRQDEVLDMIDRFARELCYIEALRDRYNAARGINAKMARAMKLYRDEKHFQEEVRRAATLLRPATASFTTLFDQVDGQTSEIINVLSAYDAMVKYVREMRDELHQRLLVWDEIIKVWDIGLERRHDEIREAVRTSYRFLAMNFPQTHDWL